MSIKLIAIDLDATLLNSHHQVTDAVKNAIQLAKEKGVHIVLASGRPYSGIAPFLQQLELDNSHCYCISNNGSVIHKAHNGEHLVEDLLEFADYQFFESLSREIGVHMHALADNSIYTANKHIHHYTVVDAYLTNTPLIYCPVEEMDRQLSFTKLMMIDHPEVLSERINYIPEDTFDSYSLVRTSPYFLEIYNKTVSKGQALKTLADKLGITHDKIMSIGDHNNDIQMLEYASMSVAMGNAAEHIQKIAKFVTGTNDEDGVATAINKFVNV